MPMTVFSFRAECPFDVEGFLENCRKVEIQVTANVIPCDLEYEGQLVRIPDVEVEIQSTATLDELRDAMGHVSDGHVMFSTLRPCALADNSLERDYGLECHYPFDGSNSFNVR